MAAERRRVSAAKSVASGMWRNIINISNIGHPNGENRQHGGMVACRAA